MIRILLALAALVGLIWLAGWLGKSSPTQRANAFKMILLYGTGGILLLLVITGRIHWLFALLGAAIPWLQRALLARQVWRMFKSRQKPSTGNTSKVATRYFRMVLDHDSGDLAGEVIYGDFAGQQIGDLQLDQLLKLQKPNGSWVNRAPRWYEGDPNLSTAYGLLALGHCQPRPRKTRPSK